MLPSACPSKHMPKFFTELELQKQKGIQEHYGSLGYKLQAVDTLLWKLYHSLQWMQPLDLPLFFKISSLYMATSQTARPEFRCLKICSMFKKMRNDKYFDKLSLKPGHFCSTSCILIRPPSFNEFALGGGCEGNISAFARGWNPVMAVAEDGAKTWPASSLSWRTREGGPAVGRTGKIEIN